MLFVHLPDKYLLGMGAWLLVGVVSLVLLLKVRRWRRRKGKRPRIINTCLGLWFVAAVLTGFELYFALFRDTTDAFNQTNVSRRWFQLHADAEARPLKFSSGEGIRYRETDKVVHEVAADVHRTVFLGDSFTFGHGIDDLSDRFSNRVGAILQEKEPGQHDVVNLAWAGTELHWVNKVVGSLIDDEFDMGTIVYVMCLNDIETFTDRPSEYADLGRHDPGFFLFRDTYFFNTLYFRVQQLRVPEMRNYYGSIGQDYTGEPWRRMTELLNETNRRCEEAGIRFVVVVFPFLHNLGHSDAFDPAHRAIEEYRKESGVPILDLRPVLERHADEGLTLNALDAHPNQRAHAIAAEEIASFLLRLPVKEAASEKSEEVGNLVN